MGLLQVINFYKLVNLGPTLPKKKINFFLFLFDNKKQSDKFPETITNRKDKQ